MTTCGTCKAGYYITGGSECGWCHPSCSTCDNEKDTDCLTCSDGYYFWSYEKTCQTFCASGFKANDTTRTCDNDAGVVLHYDFIWLEQVVPDKILGAKGILGTSTTSDNSDPKPFKNRGFYFDGVDDVFHLPPNSADA
jgi:hypothetical protein